MGIERFSEDVIKELKYYVYRLIDPRDGQTFYVGKGKGNRIFAHVKDALANYGGENFVNAESEDDCKIGRIRAIYAEGLEVIHVIQRYGMDEDTAFEVEGALIDCFPGLSNKQNGHCNSDRGVSNVEILQRNLSVSEYKNPVGISYILIKVREETVLDRGSVYEAIRKFWRIDAEKAKAYKYVVGAVDGIVKGVFSAEEWKPSDSSCGRYEFIGDRAPAEVEELFLNKRIPSEYMAKGQANPVRYIKG